MKIVHLSNTHGKHTNFTASIPDDADVIVHSGDFLNYLTLEEATLFIRWFRALPVKHKLLVGGNHDDLFDLNSDLYEPIDLSGIHFLTGKTVEIDGINFYGESAVLMQDFSFGIAFAYENHEQGQAIWSKIPSDTDVLITHGPPFGVLDKVESYDKTRRLGCKALKERIEVLPNLKLHLFGHVHSARGQVVINEVQFSNAATGMFIYEL